MLGHGAWLWLQLLALPSLSVASPTRDDTQRVLQPQHPHAETHQRKLQGRFLHITDFHPDELYKVHSSTDEGIACHRKKGLAGSFGAEKTDCDSPLSLVNATFDWVREHVKDDIDFIIWTGDTARHDSDEKNPRDTESVYRMNRMVADSFVDAIADKNGRLDVPIIPTFGNNDFLPHNIFYPGPNKWLHAYSDIWRRFIPEAQRHSFEYGGWFQVEVIPNHLAVISLNTMYFFDRNAAVDGCREPSEPGFKHMDWLRVQLQSLRERGMKAILMGHVPPARTEGKQAWDETCWQKYTLWLKQYRDVVTGSVYGHMNIDHFMLQDTKDISILSSAAATEGDTSDNDDDDDVDQSFGIQSKGNYLSELRDVWSGLPSAAVKGLVDDDNEDADVEISRKGKKQNKRKKYKKIGGKFAERYQLTLVSPSVVPNYFPTMRVVEYNISGLEDVKTWEDPFSASTLAEGELVDTSSIAAELHQELKRDEVDAAGKKHKKKKKGKKGKKGKKPHDPNLIVPDDPPKKSLPGPAYKMQPFTFMGYTQYYANLTYINNDLKDSDVSSAGWRDGDHEVKEPKHEPKPREFKYEVGYNTYDDKLYKLDDLTVKSYVKLAYRIAKQARSKSLTVEDKGDDDDGEEYDDDFYDDYEEEDEEEIEGSDDVEEAGKKKKQKKKKRRNKVWLHFLRHAFVQTATDKELKKL
ncbi:calcineurin-like phosphoesterase domain-containing protein [Sarocladium implicatum]|nr:calcineurin-like phosphoesterase domain-containing protein [Sarocladium implicatum]